jgi:hypothetical protein
MILVLISIHGHINLLLQPINLIDLGFFCELSIVSRTQGQPTLLSFHKKHILKEAVNNFLLKNHS